MENIAGSLLLNRFRVDELLFSSAATSRYRGYDLKRGLPLLIKSYSAPIQADDTVLCFQQKNLTLQTIDHPNVIPFYGLYEDQGRSFMVEKFFEGPSLAQLQYRGEGKPLPLPETLIYLKALATALEYMHGFGLVHATLDFSNIQVGRDGSIMLGNFGFARLADKPMTLTGVFGPPFCQAPEQLRGERVHPTTDTYALGILFYELATGVHPFLGASSVRLESNAALVSRLREAHQTQTPPDMTQFNPALPGGLSKTVQTALAKDPKQRYQSAQEMLEICSAVLGSSPVQIPLRLGSRPGGEAAAQTQATPPPQFTTPRAVSPVAPTAVYPQSDSAYPGGTQVIPGPPAYPAYPPDYPPPYAGENLQVEKPSRPAWLLPVLGLLALAVLLCGAIGIWVSLPLLRQAFGSPTATSTATLVPTLTDTPAPTLPPIVVPPTEAPLPPTEAPLPPTEPPPPPTAPPTEAATLPPPPTDTPAKTAFRVTIRNNKADPIYAFRDGALMGTDAIPPGRYIWYLNIPYGQRLFRFCLDPFQSQCFDEKQIMVDDDITITVQ